jgi:hypothetical protein
MCQRALLRAIATATPGGRPRSASPVPALASAGQLVLRLRKLGGATPITQSATRGLRRRADLGRLDGGNPNAAPRRQNQSEAHCASHWEFLVPPKLARGQATARQSGGFTWARRRAALRGRPCSLALSNAG